MSHITTPLQQRYQRIQTVCDNMLIRLEEYFNQNYIFEDIKELSKLELLLKLRSKLIELDREIEQNFHHHHATETENSRENLIKEIINKISKATQT